MFLKIRQLLLFSFLFALSSCELFDLSLDEANSKILIPSRLSIELPGTISANEPLKSQEKISPPNEYNIIRSFVFTTQAVNQIVEKTYQRMIALQIQGIQDFAYTGLDGNTKYVSIKSDYFENGRSWDYYMEIYNESFSDLALKAYWDTIPHEQLIIFTPSKLNVRQMAAHPEAIAEIHFKIGSTAFPYEESLFIGIDGLNTNDASPKAPDNILLFLGKKNKTIDFIGGTNNPNVLFIDQSVQKGRNWSFRGKADTEKNIAVLQIALAPCRLENTTGLWADFSIRNVFITELRSVYPEYYSLSDDELLIQSGYDLSLFGYPLFFNSEGFYLSGDVYPLQYADLMEFEYLDIFKPIDVQEFTIE